MLHRRRLCLSCSILAGVFLLGIKHAAYSDIPVVTNITDVQQGPPAPLGVDTIITNDFPSNTWYITLKMFDPPTVPTDPASTANTVIDSIHSDRGANGSTEANGWSLSIDVLTDHIQHYYTPGLHQTVYYVFQNHNNTGVAHPAQQDAYGDIQQYLND